jgi:hypothetical protein
MPWVCSLHHSSPVFFAEGHFFWHVTSFFWPLFLLYGVCEEHNLVWLGLFYWFRIICLSRHRCWCCCFLMLPLLPVVVGNKATCCLATALSITSVSAFISCQLPGIMETEIGHLFCLSRYAFFCPVCFFCRWDCCRSSPPPPKETLLIWCQGIASSTWFPFCHNMFLAAWSTSFWKHLAWPISETVRGRWSQNHILWEASSTGIRFLGCRGYHQALF